MSTSRHALGTSDAPLSNGEVSEGNGAHEPPSSSLEEGQEQLQTRTGVPPKLLRSTAGSVSTTTTGICTGPLRFRRHVAATPQHCVIGEFAVLLVEEAEAVLPDSLKAAMTRADASFSPTACTFGISSGVGMAVSNACDFDFRSLRANEYPRGEFAGRVAVSIRYPLGLRSLTTSPFVLLSPKGKVHDDDDDDVSFPFPLC